MEIISLEEASVHFDFDNDGFDELTAWISPDDALLFWDAQGDGEVHNSFQIAFAELTGDNSEDTDLQALEEIFDSNHDGVFDEIDERWSEFKLWQDKDSDGTVDDGELTSLSERNIAQISFSYTDPTKTTLNDGTTIHGLAQATLNDGTNLTVGDVAFATSRWGFNDIVDANALHLESNQGWHFYAATNSAGVDKNFNTAVVATGSISDDRLDATNSLKTAYLDGGAGDDILLGGYGNDVLWGGQGNDTLHGSIGSDLLQGGAGADQLDGGAGSDTATYDQSIAGVTVNLTTGQGHGGDAEGDTLTSIESLIGSKHHDTLIGSDQDDSLNGLDGDDHLSGGVGNDILNGGSGSDILDGGAGEDTAYYGASQNGVSVDLTSMLATGGDAEDDTLSSIENLIGSNHNDELRGNAEANKLYGEAGDDHLIGEDGDDTLSGGAGTDILQGGAGDDTYLVGLGHGAIGIYDSKIQTTVHTDRYLAGYRGQTAVYGTRTTTTKEFINAGEDTLKFAGSISVNDLSFEKHGDHLVIAINSLNEEGSALLPLCRVFNPCFIRDIVSYQ